jgi:hypothetical protein
MTEKKETKAEQPKLNIYQKLIEVRKQVEYLKKDAKGYNFTYTSGSSILSALRPELDRQGIVIITKLINPEIRDGNLFVSGVEYELVNAENPEDRFTIPWFATGRQKDPSQSMGSGLTYSERYLLGKLNLIPSDDDDPDALGAKGKEQKPESKPKASPPPPPGKKDMINAEMTRKIEAACLWAADFNSLKAVEYYHLWCDDIENGVVKQKQKPLQELTIKQAYYFWGQRIKPVFEKENWDIEVALHEYDEWLANGKKRPEPPPEDNNLPF